MDNAMFRAFFADMAATSGQDFHFPVTDCLSRSGQDIVYIIAGFVLMLADGAARVNTANLQI